MTWKSTGCRGEATTLNTLSWICLTVTGSPKPKEGEAAIYVYKAQVRRTIRQVELKIAGFGRRGWQWQRRYPVLEKGRTVTKALTRTPKFHDYGDGVIGTETYLQAVIKRPEQFGTMGSTGIIGTAASAEATSIATPDSVVPVMPGSSAPLDPSQLVGVGYSARTRDPVQLRSSDSGRTWTAGPAFLPSSVSGAFGVLPTLLGTGAELLMVRDGVIERSVDGGGTWTRRRTRVSMLDSPQIVLAPSRQAVAWFCPRVDSEAGLVTQDAGATWNRMNFGCRFLAAQPGKPSVLLRADPGGSSAPLYRSTNSGRTWKRVRVPFSAVTRPVFDPGRPNVAMIVGEDRGEGDRGQLWRSNDAGKTWRLVHRFASIPCGRSRCPRYAWSPIAAPVYGSGRFVMGPLVRHFAQARGATYLVSRDGTDWHYIAAPTIRSRLRDQGLPMTLHGIATADGLIARSVREPGQFWRLRPGSDRWAKETMRVR